MMITVLTAILTVLLISRAIEESFDIPTPLSLLALSYLSSLYFGDIFAVSKERFNELIYLMLPIILLPDILKLSLHELRQHAFTVIYLAFAAVIFSIFLGILVGPMLLAKYELSVPMLLTLFTMLMATDAISVSTIFSRFNLPDRLKVYAESESLFNDVTALVLFYFLALPLISGEQITFVSINLILLKVLLLSSLIGIAIGYLGYLLVKLLSETLEQFIIIYLVVVIAFLTAEHLHVSGILAIISSAMAFKLFVRKELKKQPEKAVLKPRQDRLATLINYLYKVPAITRKEFRYFKKEAYFVGIFANAVIFVVMVQVFDFSLLLTYAKEIVAIFALTTAIRFLPMLALTSWQRLPLRWSGVLTFSGIKGGLAIIMAHSLPQSFVHKELFLAIVIGHVILTTFGYTFVLLAMMRFYKQDFEKERYALPAGDESQMQEKIAGDIQSILEKDLETGVYNEVLTNRILEQELARSKRYKLDLSLLAIEINFAADVAQQERSKLLRRISEVTFKSLRIHDSLGKLRRECFMIIAVNTPVSGATILAQRLQQTYKHRFGTSRVRIGIGITALESTDTSEELQEKLDDALARTRERKNDQNVEIET